MRKVSVNYKRQALVVLIMVSVEYILRDFTPNLFLLIIRDAILCLFISVVVAYVFMKIVFIEGKAVVLGLLAVVLITGLCITAIAMIVIYTNYGELYLTTRAIVIIIFGCIIAFTYFSNLYRKSIIMNRKLQKKINKPRKF